MILADPVALPEFLASLGFDAYQPSLWRWWENLAGHHVNMLRADRDRGGKIARQSRILPHLFGRRFAVLGGKSQADAAERDRAGEQQLADAQRRRRTLVQAV